MTYSVPLYVEMTKSVKIADRNHPSNLGIDNLDDMVWEVEESDQESQQVFLGRVPLMVRSARCHLSGKSDDVLEQMGECPYDQVGISN